MAPIKNKLSKYLPELRNTGYITSE